MFNNLFKVTPFWTVTRVVGAVFAVLIIFQLGPEAIWNENTGGMLLSPDGLVSFLFTIFLFAGLLLPSIIEFRITRIFWNDDGENHASSFQTSWTFCS